MVSKNRDGKRDKRGEAPDPKRDQVGLRKWLQMRSPEMGDQILEKGDELTFYSVYLQMHVVRVGSAFQCTDLSPNITSLFTLEMEEKPENPIKHINTAPIVKHGIEKK